MTYPELNILHLPHRIDREELYLREFADQGIDTYKVWDGIINEQIPFAGIGAAHKRIVRAAKTLGHPKVVICEDDLRFTCKTSFKYFLENEPEDYDIYLASIYMGKLNVDNTVDDFSGLTLYMVHERYYDRFLATPMMDHIDRAQSVNDPDKPGIRIPRGKFVVCNPFACIQWTTYSENHKCIMPHNQWLDGRRLYNDKNLVK
jgi:hypothetical protein